MLTTAEMEDRLDKLDRRLDRIEQILPTLATKDDMATAFEEAKHQTRLLHEDLVERIKLVGEHRPKRSS